MIWTRRDPSWRQEARLAAPALPATYRTRAVLVGIGSCGDLTGRLVRREEPVLAQLPGTLRPGYFAWLGRAQAGYLLALLAGAAALVGVVLADAGSIALAASTAVLCALIVAPSLAELRLRRLGRPETLPWVPPSAEGQAHLDRRPGNPRP